MCALGRTAGLRDGRILPSLPGGASTRRREQPLDPPVTATSGEGVLAGATDDLAWFFQPKSTGRWASCR